MAASQLHVPVDRVTLDGAFVAELIARIWEAGERVIAFTGDSTPMSDFAGQIGEDLYRACFPFEHDESGEIVGLWAELWQLAEERAKGVIG